MSPDPFNVSLLFRGFLLLFRCFSLSFSLSACVYTFCSFYLSLHCTYTFARSLSLSSFTLLLFRSLHTVLYVYFSRSLSLSSCTLSLSFVTTVYFSRSLSPLLYTLLPLHVHTFFSFALILHTPLSLFLYAYTYIRSLSLFFYPVGSLFFVTHSSLYSIFLSFSLSLT